MNCNKQTYADRNYLIGISTLILPSTLMASDYIALMDAWQDVFFNICALVGLFCLFQTILAVYKKTTAPYYVPANKILYYLAASILFSGFSVLISASSQTFIGTDAPIAQMPISDSLANLHFGDNKEKLFDLISVEHMRIFLGILSFIGFYSVFSAILKIYRKGDSPNDQITYTNIITQFIAGLILINFAEVQCLVAEFLGHGQFCLLL